MTDQAPLFEDGELAAAPEKVCTEALSIWNEIAPGPGWPTARFLTQSRRSALRRAVKDYGGLVGFRDHLVKASRNDFLSGQTSRNGKHSNWKPDLDWFLKPANVIKILEQKFPANTGDMPAPQEKRVDPHTEERAKLRNYRPGGFWLPGWGPRPEEPGCRLPAEVLQEWRERNRVIVQSSQQQEETYEQRLEQSIPIMRKHGRWAEANTAEEKLARLQGRPPVLVPAPDARDPDVVPPRRAPSKPATDVVPDYDEIPEGDPDIGGMDDA